MVTNAVKELQSAKQQRQENIRNLEAEIAQIDASITALAGLEGGGEVVISVQPITTEPTPAPVVAGKRTMSAAARKAISKAAKARWAKVNAGKAQVSIVKPAQSAKKQMSPIGKLKIKLGSLNRFGKTAEAKNVKAQIAALEATK